MPTRPSLAWLALLAWTRALAADPAPAPAASATVSAEGLHDRTIDGGRTSREAALGIRGRLPLVESVRREGGGLSAWALAADLEVRGVALDLPEADGVARFLRLGAGLSATFLRSPSDAYRLQIGAFVAEQRALLGSAQLHPRVVAVGIHRASEALRVIYGVGYTYDFGRGLPIPFLGAIWRMAPAWRLDVLLPVVVRATWTASDAVSADFGTTIAGEQFRYRAAAPPGAEGPLEMLHVARLRLGAGCTVALSRSLRLAVGGGVEGSRVDTGLATRTAGGAYLSAALRIGGRAGGEPFLDR